MGATKKELIVIEIARLKDQAVGLERDWKRIPFLFVSIVVVAPVHWIYGPTASCFTLFFVPSLVLTAVYLIGVRRRVNEIQIVELTAQLESIL